MKLLEALEIVNRLRARDARPFRLALVSGFEPLHFEVFLAAHTGSVEPLKAIQVARGLYGDLAGNLERVSPTKIDALAVVIEWQDLDPRLAIRSGGRWEPDTLPEIIQTTRRQLARIARALDRLALVPVVVSLPTLPLPPITSNRPSCMSAFEAELRAEQTAFVRAIVDSPSLNVLAPEALDRVSPPDRRLDVKSDLLTGFPYSLDHADRLAGLLAGLIRTPVRKKGIITDLDDTLWQGILGEVGVDGVSWSLEQNAQVHGLYQKLLASLAASGTLVAVASKNDAELVAAALDRSDLLLPKDRIFPVEAHWGPKSSSVGRILEAWNVAADSVVFIDDSPMELAEVQAVFPGLACVAFPKNDPGRVWELLFDLRHQFGVTRVTAEDALRATSLRAHASFEADKREATTDFDAFLRGAKAELTLTIDQSNDPRAFELINKTNQFNLNGGRLTEAEWNGVLADRDRFVLKAGYTDRYGPLGTIAVLVGTVNGRAVIVDHWVMSCRAFSRRIEHRCLRWLFEHFDADEVTLRFERTPRNETTRQFLAGFVGEAAAGAVRINRTLFQEKSPALYHSIRETPQ